MKDPVAVDNVSFEVREGESIGLVGESGCGKSTTARLITRLLDATSGTIEFDGIPLHAIPAWSFAGRRERSLIQMVFQYPTESLNPRFSAFDVIADPLRRLRSQLGLSYIFVSHDLNVVRLLCDRVIVMNRGRIVEEGPAGALLENPKQAYTRSLIAAIPHFRPELREAV